MKPLVIYIASPYRLGDQATNVRVQIEAAHQIMDMGHSPVTPLLSHFLDLHRSRPPEDWVLADLAIVKRVDIVLRLPGESSGADREVECANHCGIPVVFGWEGLALLFHDRSSRRAPDVFSKGQPLAAYHGHDHLERDLRMETGND